MNPKADNLIWIDLEMSGLNPDTDRIIEIATVITNSELEVLAEGPVMAIHQAEIVITNMDDWNTKQHTKSGLIDRVRQSSVSELQAEERTLEFIMQYVPPNKSPMCGNSICQDRRFLYRYMPALQQYFHYRNLDVSSLKELALRWCPKVYAAFSKESKHLALADILESINELRHYRKYLIKSKEEVRL